MTRLPCLRWMALGFFLAAAVPSALAQQTELPAPAPTPVTSLRPTSDTGWTLTPSLSLSESWDDNVLMRGVGSQIQSGSLSTLNPSGALRFAGRRTDFTLGYDGSYRLYPGLVGLDSYEQRGNVSARRLLSPNVDVFIRDSGGTTPSTEFTQLVGVPFVRTGSRQDDAEAGVNARLTKWTSLSLSSTYQWVRFDHAHQVNDLLRDGDSLGGRLGLRRQVGEHTTLTGDYELQHATILQPTALGDIRDVFNIHSATVGFDHQVSNSITVFTSVGAARLGASSVGPARSGPRVRVGLVRLTGDVGLELDYSHAYVPTFTLGGTTVSDAVSARSRFALSRRVYAQTAVSWLLTQPVFEIGSNLQTVRVNATLGFAVQPWMRLETFFEGDHQSTGQPGGIVGRNQIGIQMVTTTPMRIH